MKNYDIDKKSIMDKISSENLSDMIIQSLKKNKVYTLKEINRDLLIYFAHGEEGTSSIQIGFPFPLKTIELNELITPNNQKIKIITRGESIRTEQRNELEEVSNTYKEIKSIDEFRNIVNNKLSKNKKLIYVDPYDFIGDSYIGLYFLDAFKDSLNTFDIEIYSSQINHLVTSHKVYEKSVEKIINNVCEGDVIIIPDLIDTHWEKTMNLINNLNKEKVSISIPGRNIIISIEDGEKNVFHFSQEDPLLRSKNIEDYMDDCLEPFLNITKTEKNKNIVERDSDVFFINPFANSTYRFLDPELVFHVHKNIKEKNKNTSFTIVGGYHRNVDHTNWILDFLDIMKNSGEMSSVSINYYSDISELMNDFTRKNGAAFLTTDTSIAHSANYLGIPNVSVYNSIWWDNESVQAQAGSSPFGFCRYQLSHFPALNVKGKDLRELAKHISESLMFIQKSELDKKRELSFLPKQIKMNDFENLENLMKNKLPWVVKMFDRNYLEEGITHLDENTKKYFKNTVIKLSPLYKLTKYIGGEFID